MKEIDLSKQIRIQTTKKLTQILIRNIPDSTKVSICDIKSNNIITDGFLNVFRSFT
ncbi:hypothetical protein LEP1GSC124_4882 [Leptospira interrogans serovar Pyrogenes str. 200701872]|uniref:Uncharacterized protein n=1 Tax=Leptospira interrogans serovar Pyrogenes str. 200701872 TaxID=1193029 RepID=M7A2G1_LEPIR|nr:hypothetical protein LEP1GSC124_4882 [Leptospira interrogans serovar Pyrogenes str. 200701872]